MYEQYKKPFTFSQKKNHSQTLTQEPKNIRIIGKIGLNFYLFVPENPT